MRKRSVSLFLYLIALFVVSAPLHAHPMGNFSINHYSRIHISEGALSVHVVVDFAEIPTFQLFSELGIRKDVGLASAEIQGEIQGKVEKLVAERTQSFSLLLDSLPLPLQASGVSYVVTPGAGGLPTLRVSFDLTAPWTTGRALVEFFDRTYPERIGWKEMVVTADSGFGFPDGNPFVADRSAELTQYPNDPLASAPNTTSLSIRVAPTVGGTTTNISSAGVGGRTGESMTSFLSGNLVRGDRLSEILGRSELPVHLVFLGLGIAFALGALHAFSPGHGKTLVAAYLVGNRGTARHAVFLGSVVTFTHTAGVFLLGIVTLFASQYIVPEKLYPWMGLISGLMIVGIGVNVFRSRLSKYQHDEHQHEHHRHHGAAGHTHEIPEGVTFRSLLTLGVSGGPIPCPSALVVLLSAIALHRVEFGLLLLVAFSLGLASVLVGIGMLVVRAGRLLGRTKLADRLAGAMPLVSAGIISLIGLGVAAESFAGTGLLQGSSTLLRTEALVVLGLGLVLGLKHATDGDHVVAVTTFVSESKSLWRSCWIGVFWGIGHTLSLAFAGLFVIIFKVSIPVWLEARLEFVVALMLFALGARVLIRTLRGKIELHSHGHSHAGATAHSHWHLHGAADRPQHEHAGWAHMGLRPLLVGMVHGAAGSAALMLLVLSTIRSPLEAFLYIFVFGFGSILGMLLISFLLALPLHWAKGRVAASYRPIQLMAGLFSCLFGLYLGLEIWSSMP